MKALIALTVGAALVAGCSSGPRKPSPRALKQIDRALATAPGQAQPSVIVKTELALARLARESDQKKAFLAFAAPGAVLYGPEGWEDIAKLLAKQSALDQTAQFSTKSVFMSCDGSVAVSQGRATTPDGIVGNYVFVWERQAGLRQKGDEDETGYRFTYFTAEPDFPQPPPRAPLPEPKPGDIVVEALDSIRADIGQCAKKGEASPDLPRVTMGLDWTSRGTASRDKTLNYLQLDDPGGGRFVIVWLTKKGEWEEVMRLSLPSAP